ncbi:hypothetical protein LguiB_024479 [Lonicera macranthoides]
MVKGKGKLILICQSGGEFVTKDDGTLSYDGGEANAVNVNFETLFDDLKLKLAEMCNLQYKTMSIKYFLPENRRTLISLKNDKDLKRMIDFHGDSVTADIFLIGKEGFDHDTLNILASRETGIKHAETIQRVVVSPTTSANLSPAKRTSVAVDTIAAPTESPGPKHSSDHAADYNANYVLKSAKLLAGVKSAAVKKFQPSKKLIQVGVEDTSTISRNPTEIDMSASPADTVKKRRRNASNIIANAATIVAETDYAGKKRSQKKSKQSCSTSAVADGTLAKQELCPNEDHLDDISVEKQVSSWRDGITGVGQGFKSVREFRDTLQKYAIAHRFGYKFKKNDTTRATGKCVVDGCSWKIHAAWVAADESFKIKTLNNLHTCGEQSWKSAHPKKNWLVSVIKGRLKDSPSQKPKEIANAIFQDFGMELNYAQVWRGITDAKEELQGSYKDSYNHLPWLCEKIVETNPSSVVNLKTDDNRRFQSLFVSFSASINGFQKGCRPILFLETTSLRSKFQETLLLAIAVDGNDGFFPVAFAIVDIENEGNWRWFLEQLKLAISTSQSITFVSDRDKNLKKDVLEVFENANYGYSVYHLMESFKKNLKGPFNGDGKYSLPVNLLAAARSLRLIGFNKHTQQIKQISSQAYDWVMQIEPEYWTSYSFKGEHYNNFTQNVAESYTILMEDMRELPITRKIEALIRTISDQTNTTRADLNKLSTKLTPVKEKELQEESLKARALKVLISSDNIFEVRDNFSHVVNIVKEECSCLGWREDGIPCCHAIAVFSSIGKDPYDYCSKYFTVDRFRLAYPESISPIVGVGKGVVNEEGDSIVNVLPPRPSRSLKREKKKEQRELKRANKKTVTCTRCKEAGHNKASCKAELPV